MTSAQQNTIELYQTMMRVNASGHLMRAARELGLLEDLGDGQRTLEDLCQSRFLNAETTALLLNALVALGVVEKYGDDYALSQAARLLCAYDQDLGDVVWADLVKTADGNRPREQIDERLHRSREAATQWVHTPAAMQAAEVLDVGGEGMSGLEIVELGTGSGVWSAAMAYRDPESRVLAVDHEDALEAARHTAESIGVLDRFVTRSDDPTEVRLDDDSADLVLLPIRLHQCDDEEAVRQLGRAVDIVKPGGRVVVIDLFRGPNQPTLAESVAALRLHLGTCGGRVRTLDESKSLLRSAGLEDIQFTFLAADRSGLGLAVGRKPKPNAE